MFNAKASGAKSSDSAAAKIAARSPRAKLTRDSSTKNKNEGVKIRTLPRAERSGAPIGRSKPTTPATPPWPLYALGAAAVLICVYVFTQTSPPRTHSTTLASVQDLTALNVRQKIQDSHFKEGLIRRRRALENMESQNLAKSDVNLATTDDARALGVQMDSEDTPERLFRELNQHSNVTSDNLPDDRINARLANRKWMNEEERQERVQYVRSFVRSAYDRGYQVDLNQNLVVVGVRKINKDQKISIDQVLDRLDQKGL